MKPRITILTIGVDDLEGAVRFSRDGLGLPTQGIIGTEFRADDPMADYLPATVSTYVTVAQVWGRRPRPSSAP
jgi:hypothetical protein